MSKCCKALLIVASVGAVYLMGDRCCNRSYLPPQEYQEPHISSATSMPTTQTSQPTSRASEGKLAPATDDSLEILRESVEREKGGK